MVHRAETKGPKGVSWECLGLPPVCGGGGGCPGTVPCLPPTNHLDVGGGRGQTPASWWHRRSSAAGQLASRMNQQHETRQWERPASLLVGFHGHARQTVPLSSQQQALLAQDRQESAIERLGILYIGTGQSGGIAAGLVRRNCRSLARRFLSSSSLLWWVLCGSRRRTNRHRLGWLCTPRRLCSYGTATGARPQPCRSLLVMCSSDGRLGQASGKNHIGTASHSGPIKPSIPCIRRFHRLMTMTATWTRPPDAGEARRGGKQDARLRTCRPETQAREVKKIAQGHLPRLQREGGTSSGDVVSLGARTEMTWERASRGTQTSGPVEVLGNVWASDGSENSAAFQLSLKWGHRLAGIVANTGGLGIVPC
ncbi:hypothetical protein B0I35DRAFT_25188 [Stachybotrys elegans]|uniref:Uncharacterized protein n=1 Tax=Stachybotrys elegans TaxID=80388 RepID=A0A8K0T5Z0_9HYPO|nr:hypothetical protein B0I35DRAFT_25188 [Stachybotrys elegans]